MRSSFRTIAFVAALATTFAIVPSAAFASWDDANGDNHGDYSELYGTVSSEHYEPLSGVTVHAIGTESFSCNDPALVDEDGFCHAPYDIVVHSNTNGVFIFQPNVVYNPGHYPDQYRLGGTGIPCGDLEKFVFTNGPNYKPLTVTQDPPLWICSEIDDQFSFYDAVLEKNVGNIQGTAVSTSTGLPIKDLTVTISPTSTPDAGETYVTVRTDAAGKYSAPVSSGDYLVQFSNPSYLPLNVSPVTVSGTQTATADGRLTPAGIIRGKVIQGSSGLGLSNAYVQVQVPVDLTVPGVTYRTYSTNTDANGNFMVGSLPGATYEVSAKPSGSTTTTTSPNRISVSGGQTVSDANVIIGGGTLALTLTPTPTISGTKTVGQTLLAAPGAWDSGVTLSYAWYRGSTLITTATTAEYTLSAADAGQTITVKVTGSKPGYTSATRPSAATSPIANGTLTLIPQPTISGTTTVGKTLTVAPGTWEDGVTFTYAWFRGTGTTFTTITGETQSTYVLSPQDVGQTIKAAVFGSRPGYNAVQNRSTATAVIAAGTLSLTPTPTISGTPTMGYTLTAITGTWDSGVTLSYAWYRGTSLVSTATTSTYVLAAADVGQTITVKVTGTKPGFTSVTRPSVATTAVAAGTLTLTPTPTISGTKVVGSTLTAVPGTWDPGVTLSYAWYRYSTQITGASGSTYALTAADQYYTISVKVTGSKPGFTSVTRQSSATSSIVGKTMTSTPTPTITGTKTVGQTLTAVPGTWDSGVTLYYQWFRGSVSVATGSNKYTLQPGDAGSTMTVKVTGVRSGYTDVTRASAPTSVIAAR